MNNSKFIQNFILEYYRKNKRDLPWRSVKGKRQNPYNILVSEIMLQQTRVDTVLNYYKNFLQKWPMINNLASAKQSEVLTLWSGLGFYKRAINLHKTAQIIVEKYNSKVPQNKKELLTLPGIGEYTASAILGFAYDKYSIIIDTNIERFISRINNINKTNEFFKKKLYSYAVELYPKKESGDFAQSIMDFASKICKKKNPGCHKCELKLKCKYDFEKDNSLKSIKNSKVKKYSISYVLFDKDNNILVRKRPLNVILGGLYEVPGTKWIKKHWPKEDIKFKNLQTKMVIKDRILRHDFSHFTLYIKVKTLFLINSINFKSAGVWVKREHLKYYPVSSLTNKITDYSFSLVLSRSKLR